MEKKFDRREFLKGGMLVSLGTLTGCLTQESSIPQIPSELLVSPTKTSTKELFPISKPQEETSIWPRPEKTFSPETTASSTPGLFAAESEEILIWGELTIKEESKYSKVWPTKGPGYEYGLYEDCLTREGKFLVKGKLGFWVYGDLVSKDEEVLVSGGWLPILEKEMAVSFDLAQVPEVSAELISAKPTPTATPQPKPTPQPTPTLQITPTQKEVGVATPPVDKITAPTVEETTDKSKPYLASPLEYFQKCSTGQVPLGKAAGSDFPGFKPGVPQGFDVYAGEFFWAKDYDHLLRFAVLAFDAGGNLIMVAVEGESTAREFRTFIPRMDDIPNCKYYVRIVYDEQWITVGCGVMTKTD